MTLTDTMLRFPTREQISPQFTLSKKINQTTYLIDGILHEWNDPVQDVISPVRISDITRERRSAFLSTDFLF